MNQRQSGEREEPVKQRALKLATVRADASGSMVEARRVELELCQLAVNLDEAFHLEYMIEGGIPEPLLECSRSGRGEQFQALLRQHANRIDFVTASPRLRTAWKRHVALGLDRLPLGSASHCRNADFLTEVSRSPS